LLFYGVLVFALRWEKVIVLTDKNSKKTMDGRWIWKFRNICGRASLCGIVCLVSALSTTTTTTTTTTNTKTPTTTPTVRVSIGEQIQQSTNIPELLQVANDFWLPTDDNLPLHLQTQRIHHEKRLRWSSQLLHKMGDRACCCRSDDVDVPWQESGFSRAILAASIPFQDDRPEKEGRYLREALVGLHNMFGYIAPTEKTSLPDPVKQAILQLVKRANNLAFDISLPEAAEIRWACLGIFARSNALDDNFDEKSILISQLEERVAALPFDLVPKVIDWDEVFPDEPATRRLQEEIPFHFDTIVTRTGATVTERRGTAWIAEDGIGALAYSGKLMPPHEISDPIRTIMRLVEDRVIQNRNFPRPFFDCVLCNHYPDGESACKFVSVKEVLFYGFLTHIDDPACLACFLSDLSFFNSILTQNMDRNGND